MFSAPKTPYKNTNGILINEIIFMYIKVLKYLKQYDILYMLLFRLFRVGNHFYYNDSVKKSGRESFGFPALFFAHCLFIIQRIKLYKIEKDRKTNG